MTMAITPVQKASSAPDHPRTWGWSLLILPKVLEAVGRHVGVSDGVLDVLVPWHGGRMSAPARLYDMPNRRRVGGSGTVASSTLALISSLMVLTATAECGRACAVSRRYRDRVSRSPCLPPPASPRSAAECWRRASPPPACRVPSTPLLSRAPPPSTRRRGRAT